MSDSGDEPDVAFDADDADLPDPAELADAADDDDHDDEADATDAPPTDDTDTDASEDAEDAEDADNPAAAPATAAPVPVRRALPPGTTPRFYGTRTGTTPRTREVFVVPREHWHTSRAISTYEYAGVLAERVDQLGRKGDDRGFLTDEQLLTLPGGSRLQAVAVAEINFRRCPLSIERHVGYHYDDKKIVEIIPVNDLTVPFEPAWAPVTS